MLKYAFLILLAFVACKSQEIISSSKDVTQKESPKVPVITFVENIKDIGEMKEGEVKEVIYEFVNSGTSDLLIELVTACKCTEIKWPTQPIAPGEKGTIIANFDSAGMNGAYTKTLDIIANTDPIVVEAKFSVVVK